MADPTDSISKWSGNEKLEDSIGVPLKAMLIRVEGRYQIRLQRYGNKKMGFTIPLSGEQVERLQWWY
jgi:hypothetical protein